MRLSYDLYGWVISSDVPLPAPLVAPTDAVDLTLIRRPGAEVPEAMPPGQPVAEQIVNGHRWFGAATSPDGAHHVTIPGLLSMTLHPSTMTLEYGADPRAPAGIDRVLLGGTALSYVLSVMGRPILHASAVEVEGSAIALVGNSGAGKSSVAAMLCAAGAAIVTDDVLRLDVSDRLWAWRGADCLRMRQRANEVKRLQAGYARCVETPDGRVGIRPNHTVHRRLPVSTLVFVRPDRTATSIRLTRLSGADATVGLAGTPRLQGWLRPDDLRREFTHQTEVARAVPALVATVPWTDPFQPALASELLERLSGQVVVARSELAVGF